MSHRCVLDHETGGEKQEDDTITTGVPGSDALRAGVQWNRDPIDKSENGCEQSGGNSTDGVPIGDFREDCYAAQIKCDIGNPGGDEQTQGQHYHHLVNWVTE